MTLANSTILLTSLVLLMHITAPHRRINKLQTQAAKDTTAIDDILVAILDKED